MLSSPTKNNIEIIHPRPEHFVAIQDLCKRVYPFSKPWTIDQLESHRSYFPGGQLIAIDTQTKKVVGMAFSLTILWDDYSPQDNWTDFTSGGFFHNHNPKKGKTLYGAEVMVDPEMRGRGIGKLLYEARRNIVYKYNLKRIRAGARLVGYSKFKDQLSAQEYVKQVIQKKNFDPTLSFQLGQGFVVIDVAKNYIFNDPESLGYAAVIEWLNPKVATEKDLKKQRDTAHSFMNDEKISLDFLPKELHRLVRKSTYTLGEVIKESEGKSFLSRVEYYRVSLKKMRASSTEEKLKNLMSDLKKETTLNQLKIAHAFSLKLELINVCESAYRTWKQRLKPIPQGLKHKVELKFVLTAHPTEARSPIVLDLLHRISDLLIEGMHNNFIFSEEELVSHIRLLWNMPLSKPKAPTVLDEAEAIFSLVFSNNIFDFFISNKPSYDLKLRTWVGGDKDGHPGVNAEVMKDCLNLSRKYLINILQTKLSIVLTDVAQTESVSTNKIHGSKQIVELKKDLQDLEILRAGDGNKIKKWIIKFNNFRKTSSPLISKHYQISHIVETIDKFPAFVLALELREDAGQLKEALVDKKSTIRLMLSSIERIAGSLSIINYVRGIVISHCEHSADIDKTVKLVQLSAKSRVIPVIPLFETRDALINSKKILKAWLLSKSNIELVKRHWSNHLEIMLGYSDSAKEVGVLPSRLLIQKAMVNIENICKQHSIKPVYFHGSGGSIARGGGSLKEQISWWPDSAIEKPKLTVQGEMIQRLFATKEILNSQCTHLSNEAMKRRSQKFKLNNSPELQVFSDLVEKEYKKFVGDLEKLQVLLEASPYRYLDKLKIGSRPTKRIPTEFSLDSLRAIPWVLCWTQTRSLLPTWWGIGSAWKALSAEQKEKLKVELAQNPFFSSFIKSLGFTLAKVELSVWKLYFENATSKKLLENIEQEFKEAKDCVRALSGEKKLIWHKPWLEESIHLRAPNIHILNALQVIAMKRDDEPLLKETLVGIACGMLTTG